MWLCFELQFIIDVASYNLRNLYVNSNKIMTLQKEYILALKTLRGVGTKTLLRIGNYVKENHIDVSSSKNLVYALETLKMSPL